MSLVAANRDTEITPGPTDTVSALAFSPTSDLLAASSWDNQVRIWDINLNTFNSSVNCIPKTSYTHDAPPLSLCWSPDGSKVFSAGADKNIIALDIGSGQQLKIGPNAHDAPIRSVRYSSTHNMLVSASWDRTLKYWDFRSATTPVATVQLPERAYAMDVSKQYAVVGCAEKHVVILNLNNPTVPYRQVVSALKWQTREIACYTSGDGYALGTIEGRVSLANCEPNRESVSPEFTFKCHREEQNAFSVNSIAFNCHGTFATAGGDGTYSFWDKESRQRIKNSVKLANGITASGFNRNANLYAYALGYDWSKGYQYNQASSKTAIMVSVTKDADVKPRNSSSSISTSSYSRRR